LYLHPTLRNTDLALPRHDVAAAPSPAELVAVTDRFAVAAGRWRPLLRRDPDRPWSAPLLRSDAVEVWLLAWSPGQQLPAHDHGGAAGAFTVVDGALVEDELDPGIWAPRRRTSFPAGSRTGFGPEHTHVLGNHGGPAGDQRPRLLPARPAAAVRPPCAGGGQLTRTVDQLDPASPHRIAEVRGHDQPIVVLCSEGCTSSLAAAVLQDLGLHRATDLIGGYKAWARAGLPVRQPGPVR
jgi:rhodanese-related sulfurtransferase